MWFKNQKNHFQWYICTQKVPNKNIWFNDKIIPDPIKIPNYCTTAPKRTNQNCRNDCTNLCKSVTMNNIKLCISIATEFFLWWNVVERSRLRGLECHESRIDNGELDGISFPNRDTFLSLQILTKEKFTAN